MEENMVVSQEESKAKKVVSIVLNTLFYVFIAFLLIFSISNLIGKDENVPKIFNRYYMAVLTPSMEGNEKDSFKAGDMVIAKVANEKLVQELEVGDIVTFVDNSISADNGNNFNSHRVVYVYEDVSGKYAFVCQGDKVAADDPSVKFEESVYFYNGDDADTKSKQSLMKKQCQEVSASSIKAIYTGKINKGGYVLSYLRSETGFGICIILPTALLFLLEAFFLIRNIIAVNKEKMSLELANAQEQQKADLEAEREKMKQELLAEMMKEKQQEVTENNEQETTEETPVEESTQEEAQE